MHVYKYNIKSSGLQQLLSQRALPSEPVLWWLWCPCPSPLDQPSTFQTQPYTGKIQLCHCSLSAALASPYPGAEVICSLSDCCLLIKAVTMGRRSWNTAQTVLHLFQLIFLSHFITTIYFVCLGKIELHCAVGVGIWISLLFSSFYFCGDSQNSGFFQQLSHDLLCYKTAYGDFVIMRLHQCVKYCRWSPGEIHENHGYRAQISSPRWHLTNAQHWPEPLLELKQMGGTDLQNRHLCLGWDKQVVPGGGFVLQ